MPAHSVIWLFVEEDLHEAIDPVYNAAVKREIDKLAAAIPHDRDSRSSSTSHRPCSRGSSAATCRATARPRRRCSTSFSRILLDLGNHVPADIELLLSLLLRRRRPPPCGRADRHGRHGGAGQPAVGRHQAAASSSSTCRCRATASDDAYFAPLRRLKLRPETELCLGLVHYTDGVAGTRGRLARPRNSCSDFSIGDRMRLRPPGSGDHPGTCCAFMRKRPPERAVLTGPVDPDYRARARRRGAVHRNVAASENSIRRLPMSAPCQFWRHAGSATALLSRRGEIRARPRLARPARRARHGARAGDRAAPSACRKCWRACWPAAASRLDDGRGFSRSDHASG